MIFFFSSFDLNCFYVFTYRGFSDAVNGFNDDGWSIMHCNGAEDITVAVNSTKNLNSFSDPLSFLGGVLCAKASMLLQVSSYTVFFFFLNISVAALGIFFSEYFYFVLCLFWCTLHRMFVLRFSFDF